MPNVCRAHWLQFCGGGERKEEDSGETCGYKETFNCFMLAKFIVARVPSRLVGDSHQYVQVAPLMTDPPRANPVSVCSDFVTLTVPPLDYETGWTGELWSKTNLLKWQN